MEPAAKNRVIFANACAAMCIAAAAIEMGARIATARVTYESWLTVEYASRRLRLSWRSAISDAIRMLAPAIQISHCALGSPARVSIPNT